MLLVLVQDRRIDADGIGLLTGCDLGVGHGRIDLFAHAGQGFQSLDRCADLGRKAGRKGEARRICAKRLTGRRVVRANRVNAGLHDLRLAVFLLGLDQPVQLQANAARLGLHVVDCSTNRIDIGHLRQDICLCGRKPILDATAPFHRRFCIGEVFIGLEVAIDLAEDGHRVFAKLGHVRCRHHALRFDAQGGQGFRRPSCRLCRHRFRLVVGQVALELLPAGDDASAQLGIRPVPAMRFVNQHIVRVPARRHE